MEKESGLTRVEMALVLLGGVLVFAVAIVATYSALVHWQVH